MKTSAARLLHENHERTRQLEVQCLAEAFKDGYEQGWTAAMAEMGRLSKAEQIEATCDGATPRVVIARAL